MSTKRKAWAKLFVLGTDSLLLQAVSAQTQAPKPAVIVKSMRAVTDKMLRNPDPADCETLTLNDDGTVSAPTASGRHRAERGCPRALPYRMS